MAGTLDHDSGNVPPASGFCWEDGVSARAAINTEAFRYCPALSQYVHRNVSQPLSLAQAAEIAGLEPHYFCEFFRRHAGVTFTVWLRHCRIEEAKRLMRTRFIRVTAVALAVGYRDLRTFERAFKRHEGVTPTEFRRNGQ